MEGILVWQKEYDTGLSQIDLHHRKIFELINGIYSAIRDGKDREVVDAVVQELVKYADYHFAYEETYFKEFAFEGAEAHYLEHNLYRNTVAKFILEGKDRDILLPYQILDYLEDWWIDHITSTDRKYVECFKAHGLV